MTDAETILEFIRDEADLDEDEVDRRHVAVPRPAARLDEPHGAHRLPRGDLRHQGEAHGHRLREPRHGEPHARLRRAQEGGRCLRPAPAQTDSHAAGRGRRTGRRRRAAADTSWFFYGLGLSLQTFLWFLLFLAIVVAVARRQQAHRVPLRRLLTPDRRAADDRRSHDRRRGAPAALGGRAPRGGAAASRAAAVHLRRDAAARHARSPPPCAAAGGDRGRRVALYLEEYDQFFISMLGVWLAGGVVVPLNTSLPPADVDWLVGKAAPDLLVLADRRRLPRARARAPRGDGGRRRPGGRAAAPPATGGAAGSGAPARRPPRTSRPCARTSWR